MRPEDCLDALPLVAILRGVTPDRVVEVAETVHEAGIGVIEIPLNSPDPFKSIELLSARLGQICLCGAGTVLSEENVQRAHDAGARLIVAPNTDAAVIASAVKLDMTMMPGFATASEAFTAIGAGATDLKLFPAASFGPDYAKALKSVLPRHVRIFAVGGVGADHVESWIKAGVTGFGFGSELFKPDYSLDEVAERARRLVDAVRRATDDLKK